MGEEDKYRKVLLLESRGKGRKREGRYSVREEGGWREALVIKREREGGMDGGKEKHREEKRMGKWTKCSNHIQFTPFYAH